MGWALNWTHREAGGGGVGIHPMGRTSVPLWATLWWGLTGDRRNSGFQEFRKQEHRCEAFIKCLSMTEDSEMQTMFAWGREQPPLFTLDISLGY